jgi:hypothetical protein
VEGEKENLMLLRFIGLFLPLKRVIWVMKGNKLVLRRLRKHTSYDDTDFYTVVWSWIPFIRKTVGIEWTFHGIHQTNTLLSWGEYRPWWNPFPPEEDSRLIEINRRAKKEVDGRLRKTRTLSQVWKQG